VAPIWFWELLVLLSLILFVFLFLLAQVFFLCFLYLLLSVTSHDEVEVFLGSLVRDAVQQDH
jgi:uncharacterized membrane protein YjfL (UPF0719 family)